MIMFIVLLCGSLIVIALLGSLLMWRDIHTASRVEPAALLNLLTRGDGVPVILDVRSDWEYQRGHVPGAQRVPFWSAQQLRDLKVPSDAQVIIYCELGPRATWAKWTLQRAGFTQVSYLDGHMAAWRDAGLPAASSNAKAPDEPPLAGK